MTVLSREQLVKLLKKFGPNAGDFDTDMVEFAQFVLEEATKAERYAARRMECVSNGHVFQFNSAGPMGEFEISGGAVTSKGWYLPQPVPCTVCGGRLQIVHEEI